MLLQEATDREKKWVEERDRLREKIRVAEVRDRNFGIS